MDLGSYGRLSDKSSPAAVMETRFFLIANKEPGEKVILNKTYYFSSELNSQKTEALVRSLDRCLIEILTNLEKDLRLRVKRQGPHASIGEKHGVAGTIEEP